MNEEQTIKAAIDAALAGVLEPGGRRSVLDAGLVRNVAMSGGAVCVVYELPASLVTDAVRTHLTEATRAQLQRVEHVQSVEVEFAAAPAARPANALPGVRHVIAVGAGKGGVGKSTVAVLLAVGLQRLGFATALLDADVYGPSLPKLTGTEDARPGMDDDGRIYPPELDGLRIMSMGYLVPPGDAVVWRGPMAQKYVKEFLDRGVWGELDFLIVDLPPGTGDIPLTLAQSIPLSGAVVVCTPQDVALLDCIKALRMYQKLGVHPLGIVENMSYYVCPHCGNRDEIFSHGGAQKAAVELGVPFLGAIPLNVSIRVHGDSGRPSAYFTKSEPALIEALESVVKRLADEVQLRERQRRPLPQLTIRG